MQHTIELSEAGEANLRRMAQDAGQGEEATLQALTDAMLGGQGETIRSTPGILGGDARIRDTRVPVWLLVAHKKWGQNDAEILAQYPGLNAADLLAAWDFYTANTERIEAERRANEDAD